MKEVETQLVMETLDLKFGGNAARPEFTRCAEHLRDTFPKSYGFIQHYHVRNAWDRRVTNSANRVGTRSRIKLGGRRTVLPVSTMEHLKDHVGKMIDAEQITTLQVLRSEIRGQLKVSMLPSALSRSMPYLLVLAVLFPVACCYWCYANNLHQQLNLAWACACWGTCCMYMP